MTNHFMQKEMGIYMKDKQSSILWLYIKEQRTPFAMAVIWIAIFFIMFLLTDIPSMYVWYPTLICTAFFLVYHAAAFLTFQRKHKALMRVMEHVDVTLENLPEAKTVLETDYQKLLEEMMFRKNDTINEKQNAQKEMTEYVTIWTHQIKTPLTALQLLAAETEEPEKTEIMTRLFEVEQYGDMMLQYLRLEGGGNDYVLKEYSIKSMVNQAVKYFARIFISKGIAIQIDIAEDVMVVTDEKWLVFVLKQLISNALKYTKKGSIIISLDDNQNLVIADTGIGIAAEDLPRIMERGYTGYNGRKDKKATGLGLFLTERILKQLNHSIRITSEVNVGTKVYLNLKKM